MGNFTSIEQEYQKLLQKELDKIREDASLKDKPDVIQRVMENKSDNILLAMRVKKMQELCKVTSRNLICYVSAWLQSSINNPEMMINDNDMNGLMNAVSGIKDRKKGIDILLHTQGGVVTATESIVSYLRKMFDMNIRVIVPHMAMSAGTMIACASKEILMGKESSLGPIDPQYHNVPAQGVLKEFKRAIKETVKEPSKALIWREIIRQYRPAFVGECKNIVKLSNELVRGWLADNMLADNPLKNIIIDGIMDEMGSHDASKVHDRHYDYTKCKELGLKVVPLEDNQELQDKVLSLYHCYLLSIYRSTGTIKFIENQNGQTFVIKGKRA